jgi:hypothetical protein
VLEQTATGDIVVQTDDKGASSDKQDGALTIKLHNGLAEAKAAAKVYFLCIVGIGITRYA